MTTAISRYKHDNFSCEHFLTERLKYPACLAKNELFKFYCTDNILINYEQLLFVKRHWPTLTESQAEAVTCTLAALLAQALGQTGCASPADIAHKRQDALIAVKGFIDESLALESLDASLIGRRFSMSRSSVYRLFGSEGGLANYIRRCRLRRAFSLLVSPPVYGYRRILDIAIECGFSSDMVFTRAFRKMFSLTPSEVRSMAERQKAKSDVSLVELDSKSQIGMLNFTEKEAWPGVTSPTI